MIVEKINKQKMLRKKNSKDNAQSFSEYVKKFSGRLPKNYKFDRDEANNR